MQVKTRKSKSSVSVTLCSKKLSQGNSSIEMYPILNMDPERKSPAQIKVQIYTSLFTRSDGEFFRHFFCGTELNTALHSNKSPVKMPHFTESLLFKRSYLHIQTLLKEAIYLFNVKIVTRLRYTKTPRQL